MTNIESKFLPIEGLRQAFEAAPEIVMDELGRAMEDANHLLLEPLRDYPEQQRRKRSEVYGTAFKTDRQRRFFFAALRDGTITLPYPRSGELGESWQDEVSVSPGMIIGRVASSSPHAHFAQDKPYQALILSYWRSAQEVVEATEGARLERFVAATHNIHQRMFARLTSE